MPDVQQIVDFLGRFGGKAVVTAAEDLVQFTLKLEEIAERWKDIRQEIDDLFNPKEPDPKTNMRVVKLLDALDSIESFRLHNLKDRIVEQYDKVKALIHEAIHPNEQVEKTMAADPEVRGATRLAVHALGLLQSAITFGDKVLQIEDSILEIVRTINLVSTIETELIEKTLQQGNTEIVAGQHRMRVGHLHRGSKAA